MSTPVDRLMYELERDGWQKGVVPPAKSSAAMFYKRFPTQTRCLENSDKEGRQIECEIYDGMIHQGMAIRPSVEIETTGQLPNGEWIRLLVYASKDMEYASILKSIHILLAAWEAACEQSRRVKENA